MNDYDFLGIDTLYDEDGDLAVVNGDTMTAGPELTVLQDIADRLATAIGSLFYDKIYGSNFGKYRHKRNTETNRLTLLADVYDALADDPRVDPRYTEVNIERWDMNSIEINAKVRLVGSENEGIITIGIGDTVQAAVKDFHPLAA